MGGIKILITNSLYLDIITIIQMLLLQIVDRFFQILGSKLLVYKEFLQSADISLLLSYQAYA